MRRIALAPLAAAALLGGCATTPITGDPAVTVTALAETVPVGTVNEDAADDPAIWRNAADPAKSLIVATDKKGGLYVYDLAGKQKSFLPAPGLNNVDLAELPDGRVLVAASDRSDLANARIHLSLLDIVTGELEPAGSHPVGPGEAYGICFGGVTGEGEVTVYSAPKNGVIYDSRLLPGSPVAMTRTLATVPTQPEGCIADPRTGTLYIGEEDAGIWAIDTENGAKRLVAAVDNKVLVADVEGLAIAPQGSDGGYLVASSQGDNAYSVFRLPGMEPVGRFRIAAGTFGATEETDGIELDIRSFGPAYPAGLFIAQDGQNAPAAQNFKLVSWQDVKAAIGLE
ncbi:phytase [Parerythrobacter lacustris]|uniref:Phytase n=1 Tax=Parerythrobacter lacustris TaxID=2969984 RepID=A0ABT1XWB6_9SPHN|nr:phytase [Parerythrobacter lacustris]MCR2834737.1 phytase [Parerythrobacter lacustris]